MEEASSVSTLSPGRLVEEDSIVMASSVRTKSTSEIQEILKNQNLRRVSSFQAAQFEKDAKKNWDIFYKNNSTNFFKDRHWTLREFPELVQALSNSEEKKITLLEAGCGVGNFVFPVLEEIRNIFIFACDFSPRAIQYVMSNPNYREDRVQAFSCDLTEDHCFSSHTKILDTTSDFASLIFVLSTIAPSKHGQVVRNLRSVMKPGGIVFFRDYGRYDMAQLRFKPGKKIEDNFYVRRDGTRSYYFTPEEVTSLFTHDNHFSCLQCDFITRRTVNIKEGVDVERIFIQGKFVKI